MRLNASALGAYFRLLIVVIVSAALTYNALPGRPGVLSIISITLSALFVLVSEVYIARRLDTSYSNVTRWLFHVSVISITALLLCLSPLFEDAWPLAYKPSLAFLIAFSIVALIPLMFIAAKRSVY